MSDFDANDYSTPLHHGGFGTIVAWMCRLLLAALFAGLVDFAFKSAALPPCGPGPALSRWPVLLPALLVAALAAGGAFWAVGRYVRMQSGGAWFFATLLTMGGLLGLFGAALLYMSFATMC